MPQHAGQKKAVIVGGSVAGLFAANLLRRIGWHVVVLERVKDSLASRGTGIARHPKLESILAEAAGTDMQSVAIRVDGRTAYGRDGSCIGWHEYPQRLGAWNQVFIPLREAFPSHLYRAGDSWVSVSQDDDGVTVKTCAGDTLRVDLLIAADGFLSGVRGKVFPEIQPRYAGYVAWRGVSRECELSAAFRRDIMDNYAFVFPRCGQYIGYPMASPEGDLAAGSRRYNYLWYSHTPAEELDNLLTGTDGSRNSHSIAPHLLDPCHVRALEARAEERLPEAFVQTVTRARTTMVQPIYDVVSESMVQGRVAIIGDAAFVVRPHVGIGVLKAAEDAHCLAQNIARHDDIRAALKAFNAERVAECQRAAAQGKKLGAFIERGLDGPDSDPSLGLSVDQLLRVSGRPLGKELIQ